MAPSPAATRTTRVPWRPALVLLLMAASPSVWGDSYAGRHKFVIQKLHTCSGDMDKNNPASDGDVLLDGLIHHNATTKELVWDGNVTFKNHVAYRGNSEVVLDFSKWDSVAGWREHFLIMPLGDACSAYEIMAKDFAMHIHTYMEAMPLKCPIPDADYVAQNIPARLAPFTNFPALPYGRFKIHVRLYPTGQRQGQRRTRGCVEFVTDIVPRMKA